MAKKDKKTFRTLQEIRECDTDFLVPEDIASVLQCDQYSINLQAQADPTKLGFPVIVMGRRVRIPRIGFIRFCENAGISA